MSFTMASAKLAHPSFPVTASPRPRSSLHCEHIYRNHSPNPATTMETIVEDTVETAMEITTETTTETTTKSLYSVIDYGNKHDRAPTNTAVRHLFIDGHNELVGIVREEFVKKMKWHRPYFSLPPDVYCHRGNIVRRILIRTDFLHRDPGYVPGINTRDDVKCCMIALDKLADDNTQFNSLYQWQGTKFKRQEYSPIHMVDDKLRNILIPTPLRGFLGVLTVGVHLNVFSRDHKTGEYHIWVARRALGREFSYSGMLDQIVAGGVDDKDQDRGFLIPENTLIREAREEVGLEIDPLTQKVFVPGTRTAHTTRPRTAIGKVKRASWISFFDHKDSHAGELNENQLEPGVRIIYDLEVKNDFVPQAREAGIERLERKTVSQVKKSLLDEFPRWKPNCGLVMLDFLQRRQLIDDDPDYDRIVKDLRPKIPFRFAEQFME